MIIAGTLVNIAAVLGGTAIGVLLGKRLPDRIRATLMAGLGLAVALVGLQLALQSRQLLIVIGSLVLGGLLGELLGIETRLAAFGEKLQSRFSGAGKVGEAFVVSSLLYCVGAMAIMGALQDGVGEQPTILYAKAALDGIASVALASTLGIGVAFSILPLLVYQGGISLLAGLFQAILTTPVVTEMNAVGGLLILAIALDLLGINRLPVGNLLPAIFLCVGLLWLFRFDRRLQEMVEHIAVDIHLSIVHRIQDLGRDKDFVRQTCLHRWHADPRRCIDHGDHRHYFTKDLNRPF
jgi:uncharacterized membrane protein YqgA involved in biofilm formation